MKDALKAYQALCREGDAQYARSLRYFGEGITCRAGCSDCCREIAVFPLEWHAIALWLDARVSLFSRLPRREGRCVFLKEDCCSIYPVRPLICRVHGVPLMYRTEDEDYPPGRAPEEHPYQVSWCEYNFRELTPALEAKEISDDTVIDQEELNTRLTELHYLFLESPAGAAYDLETRYTINQLYRVWDEGADL